MIIVGKITAKEVKKGQKGEYTCFTIENKKWNCFDEKMANTFNVGDEVKMTTTTNGKYENLKTMEFAKSNSQAGEAPLSISSSPVGQPSDKDRRIIAALKEIISALSS